MSSDGVTLITCTSDRPEAFRFVERCMARQDFSGPAQWIVVDDGEQFVECTLGQQHIRRQYPRSRPSPEQSYLANLLRATEHGMIQHDNVLFIEDDNWYAPSYVRELCAMLETCDLAGFGNARYYHLPSTQWKTMGNRKHAGFGSTGWRHSVTPIVRRHATRWNFDITIWRHETALTTLIRPESELVVGLKGFPGKHGLGVGHRMTNGSVDEFGDVLSAWVGHDDAEYLTDLMAEPAGDGAQGTEGIRAGGEESLPGVLSPEASS
jgi:hypothetical protein